ncbi:MAG: N-acetyl-gamma-glutamyl-phosphate reductase [Bacteroidaceae bacterium]|nr:N-acetyl-gamma-glutamyl-phosphate reductase [Bacteroidaceae bacterium]
MMKVGIIGGAGYTAGELIRLLLHHPEAEITFVHSTSNAKNLLTDVHEGLLGETDMRFTDRLPLKSADVLFLCMGHGKSADFLTENPVPASVRIIDLAQDFRLTTPEHDFIYGLPELNREEIRLARHIANPGCFATAIQLGLLPLAANWLLHSDISVNAITGSTGAGVKPAATTHFSWRTGNMSIYKAFRHQHVPEIRQSLAQLQPGFSASVDFIPYRGDFARGIFCTEVVRIDPALTEEDIVKLYKQFYETAAFTHYVDCDLDLKQVVNTNKALVHVEKFEDKLLITSVIDNLLKGASGQAVQNMNLLFGLDEHTGLDLKPSAF